jgi:CubicO group peptidase (beta-lactamase class C family)
MSRFSSVAGFILLVSLLPAGCAISSADTPSHALNAAEGCRTAIAFSAANKGVSVLALKNGAVVCEDYANGGGPDRGHEIWSGTKSFTGIMAAVAVKDRMLTLDEKVADTITEWQSDPVRSQVTIRQLLSLSSGIGNQGQPGGRAPGYRTAIATPFTTAPGEKFQYGPQSFQVFGELIQRKLKARGLEPDSRAFVKARILDPIGMTWTDWRRTPEGDAIMAQGASFTAREWARFGEFIRKEGVTPAGEQLVDPTAFRELFIGSKANPAYGVSWWLPRATGSPDVVTATIDLVRHSGELPQDMVIAGGAGNQRLYVVPSCQLTVVRQATFDLQAAAQERRDDNWSDFAFIRQMLTEYCS